MKPFNENNPVTANFKVEGDEALHGDVIVTKNNLPEEFSTWPIVTDSCLAYGEATGHVHQIVSGDFELRENPKTKEKHLKVVTEAYLKHQEHRPILLPPGNYKIGIQKEFDPFEGLTRRVAD